jgi:hypothetical protein
MLYQDPIAILYQSIRTLEKRKNEYKERLIRKSTTAPTAVSCKDLIMVINGQVATTNRAIELLRAEGKLV